MLNGNCPGNESLTIALTDLRYFSMRSWIAWEWMNFWSVPADSTFAYI